MEAADRDVSRFLQSEKSRCRLSTTSMGASWHAGAVGKILEEVEILSSYAEQRELEISKTVLGAGQGCRSAWILQWAIRFYYVVLVVALHIGRRVGCQVSDLLRAARHRLHFQWPSIWFDMILFARSSLFEKHLSTTCSAARRELTASGREGEGSGIRCNEYF